MFPAGTSNELDVQNEWEENTHTHINGQEDKGEGIMTATNSETQDEGKRDINKQYVREIKDIFSDKG